MKILVTNHRLAKPGGSETFTYTLIEELLRIGHNVDLMTFKHGMVSEKLKKKGLNINKIKDSYDLILANHNTCVDVVKEKGFIIQTCHGIYPKLEQPSKNAHAYVSISEEVNNHLKLSGFESTIIRNGINCDRFRPFKPINKKLRSVISMVHSDIANSLVLSACNKLGVNFIRLDKYKDKKWEVETIINSGDLVVGLGRSAYEAMACARNVLIFDSRKYFPSYADGFLCQTSIKESIKNNCSGRKYKFTYTSDDLAEQMNKYNSRHGVWLREFALNNFNIKNCVKKYIEIYDKAR